MDKHAGGKFDLLIKAYNILRSPVGLKGRSKPLREALKALDGFTAYRPDGAKVKALNLTKHEYRQLAEHKNLSKVTRPAVKGKKAVKARPASKGRPARKASPKVKGSPEVKSGRDIIRSRANKSPNVHPGTSATGRGWKANAGVYSGVAATGATGNLATAGIHDAVTGSDPIGHDPTIARRMAEIGASPDGVSKGGNSPDANPQRAEQRDRAERASKAKRELHGMPAGKKALLYSILGGGSGVLGSKIYGHLTDRDSNARDLASGVGGAVIGGTIGGLTGSREEKTASEASLDGMYHGYKRV